MRPVKILYCIETMEVAGAEHVMLSLIERLDRSRFEPVVCCLTEKGKLAGILESQGIPVLSLGKDPNFDLPVIPKLMKVIREHRIEMVHTHCWPANAWGRIAARLAGAPVILATEHSVHTWKKPMHLLLDWVLAQVTDRVICVSDAVRDFYERKAGIDPARLIRIYNGIDLGPFDAVADGNAKRKELNIESGRFVVAVVGRLIPEKGHRFFLESLAQVRKDFPSILGLIAGNGSCQEELERTSRNLGLDEHVRFLGERKDIPELLKAADLLVLPSSREGLPLVALEAMAAERPVIATDVGGTREAVLDGVTGFLIRPEDPQALAVSLLKILEDPAGRARMGQAGRRHVESLFSLEGMVRANEEVYETLIREKKLDGRSSTTKGRENHDAEKS